jgi:hypothetical protein
VRWQSLPDDVIRRIEKKDIPWERFFHYDPQELGEMVNVPKLGTRERDERISFEAGSDDSAAQARRCIA